MAVEDRTLVVAWLIIVEGAVDFDKTGSVRVSLALA